MPPDNEILDDLLEQWEELAERGEDVSAEDLCRDCPHLMVELKKRIEGLKALGWMAEYKAWKQTTPGSLPGYSLLSKLGQGGFGQVWKARGPDGQFVALKFVELARETTSELRVLEELKGFRHPNVVAVFDVQRTEAALVIVLELADCSLFDRLAECRQQGLSGIPAKELGRYLREAAAGIDALHTLHLSHRDIKPSNILLKDGVAKVADFGLAKVLTRSVTGHTGTLTPSYAAPEYFSGRTTQAGDQYGLAVTYCQLRGNRLPFEGTPVQVMAGHMHGEPDLTMIPKEERPVLARALAKKPENRWSTCTAFTENLRRETRKTGEDDTTRRAPEPRRRWFWPVGVVLAMLLGLLLWVPQGGQQKPNIPEDTRPTEKLAANTTIAAEVDLEKLPAFVFNGRSRILTPLERFAPVTIEAWAWPEMTVGGRAEKYVVGSDISGKSGISVGFAFKQDKPPPIVGVQLLPAPTATSIDAHHPLVLRRWVHIAAVFGKQQTVVFVDGVEVARGPATGNRGGTVFVVGSAGRDNLAHYYVGKMRSIRISQGERYSANFKPAKELLPDDMAVLVYSASRTEGMKAVDLCGNHPGTLQGVTVVTPRPSTP